MNVVLAAVEPEQQVAVRGVADQIAAALGSRVEPIDARRWSAVRERASESDVSAVIVGSATIGLDSLLDHVSTLDRPVALVPASTPTPYRLRRVLAPVVGKPDDASPLIRAIEIVHESEIVVTVLNVADADSIPAFDDQTSHETEAWAQEFLTRYVSMPAERVRFELRIGDAVSEILTVSDEVRPDLVALGWAGWSSASRSRVVRSVLHRSQVPVLLIPVRAGASRPFRAMSQML